MRKFGRYINDSSMLVCFFNFLFLTGENSLSSVKSSEKETTKSTYMNALQYNRVLKFS